MIVFAIVQVNDPDPIHWILIYLFTGFLIAYKPVQRNKALYWSVSLVLILWAIDLFPSQWEGVLLNEMGMKTLNIELGRESLGLTISALLLFIVSFLED